jgi:hypothetical protein
VAKSSPATHKFKSQRFGFEPSYPGGNIMGFTNYEFSMGGKWLQILKDIAPDITRVAAILNPDNPALAGLSRSTRRRAASALAAAPLPRAATRPPRRRKMPGSPGVS